MKKLIVTIYSEDEFFYLEKCTEEELCERCRKVGFSDFKTKKAIDHFFLKLSYKEMAKKYFMTEKSVETERGRYRQKLNDGV